MSNKKRSLVLTVYSSRPTVATYAHVQRFMSMRMQANHGNLSVAIFRFQSVFNELAKLGVRTN
jgi:hypothetical protein